MAQRRQEKTSFVGHHREATESLTSKQVSVQSADSRITKVHTIRRADGSLFLDESSRLITETATQPSPAAGEGRFWVRASDSKLIFTDDTGIDHDTNTLITAQDVLGRGNDANALRLNNLSSMTFSSGVELGTASATTVSSQIAIGNIASTDGSSNETAVGQGSETTQSGDVTIGRNAYTLSGPSPCVVVGSESSAYSQSLLIGYNTHTATNDFSLSIGPNLGTTASKAISIGKNRMSTRSVILSSHVHPNPGENCVIIGNLDGTTGQSNLMIGSNITITDTDNSVLLGRYINGGSPAGNNVIISASTHEKADLAYMGIIIGSTEGNCINRSIAIGTNAECAPEYSVALGYAAIGTGGDYSVTIGGQSSGTYSASTTPIFTAQQFRTFERRGTVTTSSAGPTTLMSFDLSAFDSQNTSFCIDVSVLGRNTGTGGGALNDTYFIGLKKFHFRNANGAIVFVSDNEETVVDTPDTEFIVHEINTTGAFATNTQGQYFFLYDGNDTGLDPSTEYFVWNDTANDQTSGNPAGSLDPANIDVPVNTSGVANDIDIADRITLAINTVPSQFTAEGPVHETTLIDFTGAFVEVQGTDKTADTQLEKLTFGAKATLSQGQYFLMHSALDRRHYIYGTVGWYVWADLDGSDTGDPGPITGYRSLRVDLSAATTADEVASTVAASLTVDAMSVTYPYEENESLRMSPPKGGYPNISTSDGFTTGVVNVNWATMTNVVLVEGHPAVNRYWYIYNAFDEQQYYVTYNTYNGQWGTDGAADQPDNGPGYPFFQGYAKIEINATTVTSDSELATATANALNATGYFSATAAGPILQVENVRGGVTSPTDYGDAYDIANVISNQNLGGALENMVITQTKVGSNGYNATANLLRITHTTASIPGVVRSIDNTTATTDPWDNLAITGPTAYSATLTLDGSHAVVKVTQRDTFEIDWVGVMRVSSYVI